MLIVYLAGPIENIPASESCDWREEVSRELLWRDAYSDITILSPTRGKRESIASGNTTMLEESSFILSRDVLDINRSDLIVVRWDESLPMRGTCFELGVAHSLGLPLIWAGDEPRHPLIFEMYKKAYKIKGGSEKISDQIIQAIRRFM